MACGMFAISWQSAFASEKSLCPLQFPFFFFFCLWPVSSPPSLPGPTCSHVPILPVLHPQSWYRGIRKCRAMSGSGSEVTFTLQLGSHRSGPAQRARAALSNCRVSGRLQE